MGRRRRTPIELPPKPAAPEKNLDHIPIPGPSRLTERCETIIGYAASAIEQDCGTAHGCTALYWQLRAVAESHLAEHPLRDRLNDLPDKVKITEEADG